ncbi:MAG: hypothetical protein O2923_14670 [Verrucomicrobia bacterium]|nr:hypothetical protein [Verrucomicrobiota bacterium]MDA1088633.1 hypothetical protein [Verrucomicrobiota bacterium]
MKRIAANSDLLTRKHGVLLAEGGSVYRAVGENGKPCLIVDESAMASLLSEEDLAGLHLQSVYEFEDDAELIRYAESRGWR